LLYLILHIIAFLAIAALLGFIIGWLLRGARFQSELTDLDARWRAKLSEVENERDRFAGDVTQANEARMQLEASTSEAQRLAETHDASLQQLRREHDTKLGLLADTEQRAGGLEKELADIKASLPKLQEGSGDAQQLKSDLAAATARTKQLERDLHQAKEANGACKRDVDRLQAQVAELKSRDTTPSGGGALGLVSSTGSGTASETSGSAGAASSGGPALGLVGSTGDSSTAGDGGQTGSSAYSQREPAPAELSETAGQSFAGPDSSKSDESDGEQPEALSAPKGGTADDLKKISGVGPKLEKTLNGLGIFHFSQIAAFTPSHVTWVDKYLRFKGRIERENWIEQAKVLAAGGETEFSRRK